MNSTDLGFFSAVASAGGIGRAAQQLHTVQSNVTQRIRELERELGVQLFHRSKAGVTLTACGQRLLPYAEGVGRLINEAQKAVRENGVPQGELRIGSMETTAALRLPPILARYAADCPEVDLQIETGPTGYLVDRVISRQLDGALVCGPVIHGDLDVVPVVTEELVLASPPSLTTIDQLASRGQANGLKAIVFRAGCSYRQRLSELLHSKGIADVRWMEMGTLDGIIGCVASSVGISLLPRSVAIAAESSGQVRLHTLPKRIADATTVLVRRKDAFRSAALQAFADCSTSGAVANPH